MNKKGGKAKGIDANFMEPLWKDMHKAAKAACPPGRAPFLYLDRAPAHTAKLTAAALDRIWGKGELGVPLAEIARPEPVRRRPLPEHAAQRGQAWGAHKGGDPRGCEGGLERDYRGDCPGDGRASPAQ